MSISPIRRRYRGTVIVERDGGILVNATRHGRYLLPGGQTQHGESRLRAAIRELEEETSLRAYVAVELFDHVPSANTTQRYQDLHKVFYVKARGTPAPSGEVIAIAVMRPGDTKLNGREISAIHRAIVTRYIEMRAAKPGLFAALETLEP